MVGTDNEDESGAAVKLLLSNNECTNMTDLLSITFSMSKNVIM